MQFQSGPLLDTISVEIVPTVAWQWCYLVKFAEIEKADAAFDMLRKSGTVHSPGKFFQSNRHRTLVLRVRLLRSLKLLLDIFIINHVVVVWRLALTSGAEKTREGAYKNKNAPENNLSIKAESHANKKDIVTFDQVMIEFYSLLDPDHQKYLDEVDQAPIDMVHSPLIF